MNTMKKEYIHPAINVQNMECENIMVNSLGSGKVNGQTPTEDNDDNQFSKPSSVWDED